MALLKTAVFVASRFQEFAQLRELLKRKIADYPVVDFAPVDLNDGSVSHRPPLEKCLGYVRRSEFMILLVGDTYGSLAPGFDKSFTHLEYEEATREGASTRVLVFMIGESYRDGRIRYSDDPAFAAWQGQLEARHTLGYLPPELSAEEQASRIFDQLLAALYEMRFGVLSVDIDGDGAIEAELFDAVSEEALDDTEVAALERRDAQLRGVELTDADEFAGNPMGALLQPAAVAAREQRQEASRAIELQDYGVAVAHLRRAVELKPLDIKSNYWLAQLYIALGRKDRLAEAEELAERAGRVASHDALKVRAAAAYMLAARAALGAERRDEGLRYASLAVEEAPWFARAHIELARQQVASGRVEAAVESIRAAYQRHASSLKEVYGDPAFRGIRGHINSLVNELKTRLRGDIEKLRSTTREIANLYGERLYLAALEELSLPRLVEEGRRQIRDQQRRVSEGLAAASEAEQAATIEGPALPFTRETFVFKRAPDGVVITEWHKRPGDEIRPGEAIFSYRYHNSGKTNPFTWRRGGTVRLFRTPEQSLVTTENPWLFDHLPVQVRIPEKTAGQLLQEAAQQAHQALAGLEAHRLDCEQRIKALGKVGFFVQLVVGVALLAGGGLAIALEAYWGLVIAAFGLHFLRKAHRRRKKRLAWFEELDGILAQESHVRAQRQNIEARIQALREAASQAADAAGRALRLFERRALSQRATLVPFKTLTAASPGQLIRVTREQLSRGGTEQGRRIRVLDWLPGLDDASGEENPRHWLLFRVQELNEQEVVLSRQGAYRRAGSV